MQANYSLGSPGKHFVIQLRTLSLSAGHYKQLTVPRAKSFRGETDPKPQKDWNRFPISARDDQTVPPRSVVNVEEASQ